MLWESDALERAHVNGMLSVQIPQYLVHVVGCESYQNACCLTPEC